MTTAPDAPTTPDAVDATPRAGRLKKSKGGPQPYDFRRPTKLSREHIRVLQIVWETFARRWSTLLTTSLRAVSSVSLASIEQLTYDEYVTSLSSPTVMNLMTIEPLPGTGVFEISLGSAMATVDHLLGGPGGERQPERPLSEIESGLVRTQLTRVLGELAYAFESVVPIKPEITGVEYNPQFAQAAAASDVVIVSTFELKIGALDSAATICLPFTALLPKLEIATGHGVVSDRDRAVRARAHDQLQVAMLEVPVEVAVQFEPVGLSSSTLAGLAVGDVVRLGHKTSAPLAVRAADVTFAQAVPGAHGKRLAVLVVEPQEETAS